MNNLSARVHVGFLNEYKDMKLVCIDLIKGEGVVKDRFGLNNTLINWDN